MEHFWANHDSIIYIIDNDDNGDDDNDNENNVKWQKMCFFVLWVMWLNSFVNKETKKMSLSLVGRSNHNRLNKLHSNSI